MFQVLPSLASSNLADLGRQAARVRPAGVLHLVIEDGNFSPGITFGPDTVRALSAFTDAEMDAHLMVTDPESYIAELAECGVRKIAVHLESTLYPSRALNLILQYGMIPGLALNYGTPVENVMPYLDLVRYVLLLTNESDRNGIRFKPYSITRIRRLRSLLPSSVELWTDGGITAEILPSVAAAGADCAVMGRAVFSADDPAEAVRSFCKIAEDAKNRER